MEIIRRRLEETDYEKYKKVKSAACCDNRIRAGDTSGGAREGPAENATANDSTVVNDAERLAFPSFPKYEFSDPAIQHRARPTGPEA
jgi:hypothetical protein